MAFTLAHPAAAIPLLRPLGRNGVLSALVIGSMVPDFWYFIPLAGRNTTHMANGLLTYCLPVGVLVYWVFHVGLKQPLIALFPERIAARLHASTAPALPRVTWSAVVVSIFIGAATHQLWDTFTHSHGTGVRLVPGLQFTLFSVGALNLRVFHVLQIGTTLIGLYLIARWIIRWLHETPTAPAVVHRRVAPGQSALLIAALIALAASAAVVAYVETMDGLGAGFSALAGAMVRSILGMLAVAALAYSAAWHLRQARNHRRAQ